MSLPRNLTRWSLMGLAATLITVFVVATIGLLWLSSSLPQTQGRMRIAGLHAPVAIERDNDGIPHIQAASEHDAYLALGFIHAQDRLWQMEATRRIGAGRLSEILGTPLLGTDKFMRSLGIYRRAEELFAAAPNDLRAVLEAYASGVNGYLAAHKGALPPEFYVLRVRPEPWRPADSLVWGQLMGLRLAGDWRDELAHLGLASRLTAEQMSSLFDDSGKGPVTVPDMAEEPQRKAQAPLDASQSPPTTTLDPAMIGELVNLLPPWLGPTSASNSWVISGQRTASGKPLLANDPHLALDIPNTWYLARISAPGLHVSGATAPGVPLHVIGHNEHIAWGLTNTGSDVQDLFIETIDPLDPNRYLTPDGSQPFVTRQEIILPRHGEPVTITVRETRHGPVISDLIAVPSPVKQNDEVLAFSSPGLRGENQTATALYQLNRATDWNEFTAALRHFHYPQQNIAYADVMGNVGLYVAGLVPIRKAGDGAMPAPGSTGDYDWTGYIPFEDLPHSYNPSSGRLINANNRVVQPDYPYALGRKWEEPYRARRIESLLDGQQRHDIANMMRMQGDTASLAAQELLRLMLPLLQTLSAPTPLQQEARELLLAWNGDARPNLPQPLIFTAWLRELNHLIEGDELGPDFVSLSWGLRPTFIATVLTDKPQWCDDITTPAIETCELQVQTAFGNALDQLSATYGAAPRRWRWGDAHRVTFSHRIIGRIPVIGPLFDVVMETPGDDFTINRGSSSIRNEAAPFAHVHGANLRAIYDLDDLSRSRFIIAGGQSGNPLSSAYSDWVERWRDVAYVRIAAPVGRPRRLLLTPDGSQP